MALLCFGNKKVEDSQAKQRNEEIERMIRRDQKQRERQVKMLLLGAGESGKSTVIKQMRVIHTGGFSVEERKQWRATIFSNLLLAFSTIFRAMDDKGIAFTNMANEKYTKMIRKDDSDIAADEPMPPDYLAAFADLWADAGVQFAMEKGNEYALQDNLSYFFQDITRLFAKDYLPTDQDILRARLRTTGIHESQFEIDNHELHMFDVGGQRSERKKWEHCFEDVHVVLFLVAISGYDQALVEDQNTRQMDEALMIFTAIANSKWFRNSSIILFLNKMDLFREKVESGQAPIKDYFPDYDGDLNDIQAGQEFFASKFRNCVSTGKEIYIHYTNATDTDLLKKTMRSVQDMIVQQNLRHLIL